MAGMIKTEMIDCLEQVAKLQSRMERLQEAAEKEAAEEIVKTQEVEPNLKVMSDWLEHVVPDKKGATFQRTVYLYSNHSRGTKGHPTYEPTKFMKQYIEATHNMFIIQQKKISELEQEIKSTHNMFLIQQKRINKLEQEIEGMYPKLLNEDFEHEAEDSRRL